MGYPKELTERRQWVCWRLIPDKAGSKDKKVPFNPNTGKPASSNKAETWTDYATAVDAVKRYGFTGLGFMFSKKDGVVGVDIDDCYDQASGSFNETAAAIISRQPTYAEFSPSGKGVHLFFKGSLPEGGNKNTTTGVEMYDSVRYFTMTGKKLDGALDTISEDSGTLRWIHETFIRTPKKAKKKGKPNKKAALEPLSDEELLEKAKSSGSGENFTLLWEGRWQDSFASQSEADLSLCCKLAFWSGKDREQMDRLFRQSALFREKWDEKHHASGATYGEETLNKALEATDTVYSSAGAPAIFEHEGRYFRTKGDNIYPITNFLFKPVEMIVSEEETQLTADLITVRGETLRQTFMTTDFSNQQKFKGILNRRTIALSYLGSEGDLELLKGYISELEWQVKTGVKALGIYEHGGRLVFVSSKGAIEAGGTLVEDIVQLEKYRSISSTILSCGSLKKEQLQKLGEWLMTYNEPAKAVSILAWTAGCFIKTHLRKEGIKFPHLFLIGEAGSGKSNTLERVILPIFSRTKVTAAAQVTAFTLMKESASSNIIPQPMDEFKPSKIDKTKLNALYNHFRDTYDGHEGIRGRADQTAVTYELLAPLIVAGEESADEAAVRERSIELLFSKKDLKPVDCRKAFNLLCANEDLLGCFGRSLLDTVLQTQPAEVHKWYEEGYAGFAKELPSRIVNNLACCYAGLCLVEKLCISLGLTWAEVFPYNRDPCKNYLEFAAQEYLLDGGTNNKSIVELTFEIMSRMGLDPKSEYNISADGKVLSLWMNHVYDRYTKYRKDYAICGEVLSYAQFKKQLMHSDFFLESNVPKRFGSDIHKAWTIDYAILKARCDVSGFEITEIDPL
ncbi:DNA primase [Pelotomaculum propionicicum]|uniref:phage NrS-1 polymerase family protein n=1 Tax=Pelotomaculum propionicicum TaxID=258475 RepID=UPI003B7E8437